MDKMNPTWPLMKTGVTQELECQAANQTKTTSFNYCQKSVYFPDRREKEKAYTVEDMGEGVATTWSARPVAHLGPIKETLKPRPPHALMHDAHSLMHGNEYYFIVMGKTDASFA